MEKLKRTDESLRESYPSAFVTQVAGSRTFTPVYAGSSPVEGTEYSERRTVTVDHNDALRWGVRWALVPGREKPEAEVGLGAKA